AARNVVLRPRRTYRQALGLERREPLVQAPELIRHARKQTFAVRRIRGIEAALITLVRHVRETTVRPHDTAVRALPILKRVVRVDDDGVLVRVRELGVVWIAVLCEVAPCRS